MLDFKANKLIRKQYEVAYYGKKGFSNKLDSVSRAKINNPSSAIFSPFPVAVDIVRSIQNRKKYASKVSDFIKSLLLVYKLVTRTKMSLYTLFVTSPNCVDDGRYHIIDPRNNGRSPFTSYHRSMNNIRKSWQRNNPYLHNLVSAMETTFGYRVSFNVHLHGLLGSAKPLTSTARHHLEAKASRQMSRHMNNEPVTVHIKPFKDKRGSRLSSVTAFIHYILKQYRLPVCKDMNDYRNFMARPEAERHALVTSLINSTRGSRSTTHVISKQSAFVKRYWNIHRTAQPTLVNVPTTVKSTHKHWTRHELWAKAERRQQAQNIIDNGVKRLHTATSDPIHKIIHVNKNAARLTDDDFYNTYVYIIKPTTTSDRMRFTGIPP